MDTASCSGDSSATCINLGTCTTCGGQYYSAHTFPANQGWDSDAENHWVSCTVCHEAKTKVGAHFFVQGNDSSCLKAIPHKERTAKRSGKRYNKEVKKQLTMSLISDELGQASTKKKEFLGIMEKLIPWSQWVGIVQPHYYKGERGNKPYDLELMLRIYVLQHLYNLADDAARNEIIDSRAFSQFCGVDSSNQVPDGDTIGRFRHILERNQLGEAFFTNVVESLQKCNLMLKKGTIVDSTLIAAPSSTKNKEKQRDPEAHSVKKGNQWYFGYKEHIGVDADSGLVHTVETTAANRRIVWTSILFSPRSRITRLIWIMLLP